MSTRLTPLNQATKTAAVVSMQISGMCQDDWLWSSHQPTSYWTICFALDIQDTCKSWPIVRAKTQFIFIIIILPRGDLLQTLLHPGHTNATVLTPYNDLQSGFQSSLTVPQKPLDNPCDVDGPNSVFWCSYVSLSITDDIPWADMTPSDLKPVPIKHSDGLPNINPHWCRPNQHDSETTHQIAQSDLSLKNLSAQLNTRRKQFQYLNVTFHSDPRSFADPTPWLTYTSCQWLSNMNFLAQQDSIEKHEKSFDVLPAKRTLLTGWDCRGTVSLKKVGAGVYFIYGMLSKMGFPPLSLKCKGENCPRVPTPELWIGTWS